MARYIDVDKADVERISCFYGAECRLEDVKEWLDEQPTADVQEVKHGEWKWGHQNGQYGIYCTNCNAMFVDKGNVEEIAYSHDYCPKCGAKMARKGDT